MPVEIRKITIKAQIQDGEAGLSGGRNAEQGAQVNQQAIIDKCVQQVLKILQKEKER